MTNMSPFKLTKRGIKGLIKKILTSDLVTKRMSKRFKRLIFVASVIALINDIKNPPTELINRLNSVLKLAKDDNAIWLPMHIHSFIWRDSISNNFAEQYPDDISISAIIRGKLNLNNTDLMEFIYTSTPKWLIYGDRETVFKDLVKLFIFNLVTPKHN